MELNPAWLNVAGSLVVGGFGLSVWALRRDAWANRAFAIFAIGLASVTAASNLFPLDLIGRGPLYAVLALAGSASAIGAGIVAWVTGVPQRPGARRDFLRAASVAIPFGVILGVWAYRTPFLISAPPTTATLLAVAAGVFLFISGVTLALLHWALRYGSLGPEDAPARSRIALLATGLTIFVSLANVGNQREQSIFSINANEAGWWYVRTFLTFTVAGAWLWASARSDAPRPAVRVALITLASAAIGMALLASDLGGGHGTTRLLMVAVLAYGIVRYQVLGIDVKVKWTLKQSTVAAIFIATIFLASEGVQILFGEENAWLGVLAGGVLVFALAPLQRFAERVSDAAMPGVRPPSQMGERERLALYRDQVAVAYADDAVDRRERAMLEALREHLNISAEDAVAIERDVSAGAAAQDLRPSIP